jgi:Outer membrane protein beta-barrel domain
MKKLLFPAIFALIAFHTASAQIQFGVKAGYSLCSISIPHEAADFTVSSKSAFHGGILVNIPLVAGLSLQPEAVYSGQGGTINSDGDHDKLSTGLINIPVMIQYHYKGAFIETGPQLGFLLSAKVVSGVSSFDAKSDLKSTEMAWGVGIGYTTKLGLGIDVRYNFGLGDITKSQGNLNDESGGIHSSVLQIGLFYMFGIPKK